MKPQLLVTHAGWPFVTGGHAFPHMEQFFRSLVVLLHDPLQFVGLLAGHDSTHPNAVPASPDAAQMGADVGHAVVQPPQVAGCERSASHPLSGLPSQSE
jgi:hypothetical protein